MRPSWPLWWGCRDCVRYRSLYWRIGIHEYLHGWGVGSGRVLRPLFHEFLAKKNETIMTAFMRMPRLREISVPVLKWLVFMKSISARVHAHGIDAKRRKSSEEEAQEIRRTCSHPSQQDSKCIPFFCWMTDDDFNCLTGITRRTRLELL